MTRLIKTLYNTCLCILMAFLIPKYFWDMLSLKKYRKSFFFRWGFKKPEFSIKNKPVIWIHAASLGEAKAALSVCRELKKRYPDYILVFSSITETGFEEVKLRNSFVNYNFYLPLDLSFLMKQLVKTLKPKFFITVESEFWPNLFSELKNYKSKIILINGKISRKSFERFQKASFFKKYFFDPIDLFCVQNQTYKQRFSNLGVPENKIFVSGNIKFDSLINLLDADSLKNFNDRLKIKDNQPVITIGSSHENEEEGILKALESLISQDSSLKIILVPRHPERSPEIESLLKKFAWSYVRYSSIEKANGSEKIILVDQIGLLNSCYQISNIAIVGGSFVKVGGHNLIEPIQIGIPTFYGPYTFNQFEMSHLLKNSKLGFETSYQNLSQDIHKILYAPDKLCSYKKNCQVFLQNFHGAVKTTCQKISELADY